VDNPGSRRLLARLEVARAIAFVRRSELDRSEPEDAQVESDLVCACGALVVPAQRRRLLAGMTLHCARCGGTSLVTPD
jgi:hypothetical protein